MRLLTLPEPTVRQYDRLGYAGQDIQYNRAGGHARRAGRAQGNLAAGEQRLASLPSNAFLPRWAFDSGKWRKCGFALYNTLLHFDKKETGARPIKSYTPQGARIEANTILVDNDRLLIGSDRWVSLSSRVQIKKF